MSVEGSMFQEGVDGFKVGDQRSVESRGLTNSPSFSPQRVKLNNPVNEAKLVEKVYRLIVDVKAGGSGNPPLTEIGKQAIGMT